jgi:deoxyribonuclease-4
MRIGCHLSIAKGMAAAVRKALELEAESFQYFTRNPRGLRNAGRPDPDDSARGAALAREHGIVTIGHTPYLLNLSSPDEELRRLSVDVIRGDLATSAERGSVGIVAHCGKHKAAGEAQGLALMRQSLEEILQAESPVRLLLENTARQGSEVGYSMEQLLFLVDGLPVERLGFCLDTCHAFASELMGPGDPTETLDLPAFTARLGAVHLNDSKGPYGCRVDRHARLTEGTMGEDRLVAFLHWPALDGLPVVLETPVEDEAEYGPEMAWVRRAVRGEAA